MDVTRILWSLLLLLLLYKIYEYSKELDSCSCVSHLKSNINVIQNTELFLIVIQVLGLLGMIGPKINIKRNKLLLVGSMIYLIVLFSVLLFFLYNVYVFGSKLNHCECANKWQKNVLYAQAGLYSFAFILVVILIILFMFK
jgi:hypothetical protein